MLVGGVVRRDGIGSGLEDKVVPYENSFKSSRVLVEEDHNGVNFRFWIEKPDCFGQSHRCYTATRAMPS